MIRGWIGFQSTPPKYSISFNRYKSNISLYRYIVGITIELHLFHLPVFRCFFNYIVFAVLGYISRYCHDIVNTIYIALSIHTLIDIFYISSSPHNVILLVSGHHSFIVRYFVG